MLQHLGEPIFIDCGQDLQVELLDDQDGKSVVAVFQEELDDVLWFELLKLLERDSSCKIWRIPHFREHNRVLDNVDIPVRVEIRWITEFLGKRSCSQKMLQHINIIVLKLSSLKQGFDTCLELLFKLTNDLVSTWIVEIDRLLSVVQLCGGINRGDGKRAHCGLIDLLEVVGALARQDSHAIDLVKQVNAISAS